MNHSGRVTSFHVRHFGGHERVVVYQNGRNCGEPRRDFGVAEPRSRPQCSGRRPAGKGGSRDGYEILGSVAHLRLPNEE